MMKTAALGLSIGCVESYILYDRHCRIFKVLNTRVDGLSPRNQWDKYLDKDSPQNCFADVQATLYRRPDEVDAALISLTALMIKQLKCIITDVQLFNLPETTCHSGARPKPCFAWSMGRRPSCHLCHQFPLVFLACPLQQYPADLS